MTTLRKKPAAEVKGPNACSRPIKVLRTQHFSSQYAMNGPEMDLFVC